MKLSKSKLEKIKLYFKSKPVLKAYLFGSYNRNEATKNSDIDLLVELDYTQKIGLQFVQMQIDLETILQQKVDLISANAVSIYMKPIIDKEKSLIYAK